MGRKNRSNERPNFLDDPFDPNIQQSMSKSLFELVRQWVSGQVGVDITCLTWAIAFFASANEYANTTIT
jgi:hypothetical protein